MKKIISIPPNYFYISTFLIILSRFIFPEFNLIKSPHNFLGILPIILGFYLIMESYFLFKKHKTPENFSESKALVIEGIYKFSRNPMYLGAIIFLIGLSVLIQNILSFAIAAIFFFIIDKMFIPFEEEKMQKTFKKGYADYKKKTKKWI